jgi:hypothetical protein
MVGMARAAKARSLLGRGAAHAAGRGSPNPGPQVTSLMSGASQAGPQARLSCCPQAAPPNPARKPGSRGLARTSKGLTADSESGIRRNDRRPWTYREPWVHTQ